jgi:glycosyltransferase involved in cell wall biosynthesis
LISYTESQEQVARLFCASHLFAISSLQENFPNTIVESMLCGTPVAGFRTGGIPEMINHKKDGYLAAHRSAADLAEGMRWIIQHLDYQALSVRAREVALERFSLDRSVDAYLEVYQKVLEEELT